MKLIQLNQSLTVSIHFDIHPLKKNLSYLFIYQFDQLLQCDQLDGSILFCPSSNGKRAFTKQSIQNYIYIYVVSKLHRLTKLQLRQEMLSKL